MNDLTAAQLITRSFSQKLSASEQAELEHYLAQSPTTRAFADISQRIQQVIDTKTGLDSVASLSPGLSDVARARLERKMKQLLDNQNAQSTEATGQMPHRKVAESQPDYTRDTPTKGDPPAGNRPNDAAGPTSETTDS
ncbi:MAG TPA: hypothetical protein DCF63_08800 [Planctomycetaceae bacterium]|nr:hypothetical protein [Planctomycetaceae bacterium]